MCAASAMTLMLLLRYDAADATNARRFAIASATRSCR
jgi:hypothetical protein